MRNPLKLVLTQLGNGKNSEILIPQRGEDEEAHFNVWGMELPGFHVLNRPFLDQVSKSIWVTCPYIDPSGDRLVFQFVAGNHDVDIASFTTSIKDAAGEIIMEAVCYSKDLSLNAFFSMRHAIVELRELKAGGRRRYSLALYNVEPSP